VSLLGDDHLTFFSHSSSSGPRMKVEDEVDTTDGGRNSSSNLLISGLPIVAFLKTAENGEGGQLSSFVAVGVASADGVQFPPSWTRVKTAETTSTTGRSGLEVCSVVAPGIRVSGRALTCLEGGRNVGVIMDAEDLGRGRGNTGTFPIPLAVREAGRTGLTSLARAEEEATFRSLNTPVETPAVASRLALVKIGLRFVLEAAGLEILESVRA
jgi:hypothetical protein